MIASKQFSSLRILFLALFLCAGLTPQKATATDWAATAENIGATIGRYGTRASLYGIGLISGKWVHYFTSDPDTIRLAAFAHGIAVSIVAYKLWKNLYNKYIIAAGQEAVKHSVDTNKRNNAFLLKVAQAHSASQQKPSSISSTPPSGGSSSATPQQSNSNVSSANSNSSSGTSSTSNSGIIAKIKQFFGF